MHYATTILGFAAAVSAIDIRLHNDYYCRDRALTCTNRNPGDCCNVPYPAPFVPSSASFAGIQTGWNIQGTLSDKKDCVGEQQSATNNGADFLCVKAANYQAASSATYSFVGAKKREEQVDRKDCYQADTLFLADGLEFDISTMSDEEVAEFWELTANVTTAAYVPEKYMELKK